jgi:hypothetical protein
MPKMTWQAPGAPPSDPFAAVEADVRAMTSSPWWMSAYPPQRAEAITSRMLAGAGEWWLFGVWGRWYRCGLDGTWHLCPPPFDPTARSAVMPAPPGAGRPPVPPSVLPTGPDLTPGPLASDGLFGAPPPPQLMARLQQTLAAAAATPLPIQHPQFTAGTPGAVATCFFAVAWCAGAPVADPDHPVLGLFAPFLTSTGRGPRWFPQPDMRLITGAYTERLRAGDPMGAAHILRLLWETAEALRADPAFRPRADALSAMTGTTMQLVQSDFGGIRYGEAIVMQELTRRCPPHLQITLLRETAPGDHFRLACYDLAAAAAALPAAAAGPTEARHVSLALLAADLDGMPGSALAVMPWLDPDGARTLQGFAQPDNPLRRLWPTGTTLPAEVSGADPQILRTLLAASYATDLAWCRLAGIPPSRTGFNVPAALMNAIAAGPAPDADDSLTPWEIIEAARAHLAEQRKAETVSAAPPAPVAEQSEESSAEPGGTMAWPGAAPPTAIGPSNPSGLPSASAVPSVPAPSPVPPAPGVPAGGPGPTPHTVEAFGIAFLPGADDIERLLTELRRRGKWLQSLRGQEVSSASAPAVLLVGDVSCGQRRLTRMIARTLAEAGVTSGEVRSTDADDLAFLDPRQLRERLDADSGHTLLIEGLDALILDDDRGPAYATALYRARVEGVSATNVVGTCAPARLPELTEASPELVADFRVVRLPDLSDGQARAELAAVLASERHLRLTGEAWELARRDLAALRGRGRFTNARLVETYLDRACGNHLGRAGETQVFRGENTITLTGEDVGGVAATLEP